MRTPPPPLPRHPGRCYTPGQGPAADVSTSLSYCTHVLKTPTGAREADRPGGGRGDGAGGVRGGGGGVPGRAHVHGGTWGAESGHVDADVIGEGVF